MVGFRGTGAFNCLLHIKCFLPVLLLASAPPQALCPPMCYLIKKQSSQSDFQKDFLRYLGPNLKCCLTFSPIDLIFGALERRQHPLCRVCKRNTNASKAPFLFDFGRQACTSPSLSCSWEFHEARVLPVAQLVKGHRLRKLF